MEKRNRGRKENPEYSKEKLLEELRNIQLSGNRRKLTYLGLEKKTSIPRRNWKKVSKYIENINEGFNIEVAGFKCDLALPSIEEIFDLYYGKNKQKLMNIFSDYNLYLNQMWECYSQYDIMGENYKHEIDMREETINNLKENIKKLEQEVNYYKSIYEEQCINSTIKRKRDEQHIKENYIHIKNGDKSKLSMDFKKEFEKFLTEK